MLAGDLHNRHHQLREAANLIRWRRHHGIADRQQAGDRMVGAPENLEGRLKIEGRGHQGRVRIPGTVVALGLVSLLNDLGGDAVTPLLPAFVAAVGGGPQALGFIEGAADASASLVQLVSGYLADRTGKLKTLALAGYGIANSLRPLLALVTAWPQILLIRFGDRTGKGLRGAPRDALLADSTPPELRGTAYGLHRGMDHIGAFLGPALAYMMLSHGIGVRAVFAWTAVAGGLCLIVLGLFVKETARPRARHLQRGDRTCIAARKHHLRRGLSDYRTRSRVCLGCRPCPRRFIHSAPDAGPSA
jgi:hypothetical protein